MDILVKMYSSNWETYKKHYKKATTLAFAQDSIKINKDEIRYELIDIPGDTIQKQRHGSTEHSRCLRVYADGVIKYVIGLSNTNYDEDKRIEAEEANKRLKAGQPLNGDEETERSRAKYVYADHGKYHGNSFLCQGIHKIFFTYLQEKANTPNVKLFFYLLDIDKTYCSNPTNIHNCRKLATVGFTVLNVDNIERQGWQYFGLHYENGMDISYLSFNQLLNAISSVSNKNKGNIPAYIKCIEDETEDEEGRIKYNTHKYIYTFKTLGAQAYECFLDMWALITLAKREKKTLEFLFAKEKFNFRLGQDTPNYTEKFPDTITELFKKLGIDVEYESTEEVLQQLEREKSQYEQAKSKDMLRNQEMFRNNLRAKGLQTKCYLCGCEVESILEAAHLWGVSEIKKATPQKINKAINEETMIDVIDCDSEYSNDIFYKRYMLANSGHNGVWLCSNHHGMFDSHHFIFNSEDGRLIVKTEDSNSINYIEGTVIYKSLDKNILSPETKTFLKYANQ